MPKTVSASEAKNRLGAIIGWVLQNQDEVIVESRGEPKVVVMPFSEYEHMKEIREQARRQEAIAKLRKLRDQVRARNQDLSEDAADALAGRFSREIIEDMAREGKIEFEK
ncbi:MAG: type II toxin-antitoxin system Phd/YefM family antitoxin [Dehalococcoidia bacterium]|nr:type II toxin-antitoxin system Phd/YefM family antitoxin [Dehalococcoidia bacterium]